MKQASVVLVLILLLVAQLNSFAEQVHENTQSNEIDRSDFAVDLAAKAGRSEALTTKAEGSIKKKEYRTAEKLLLEALTIDDSNVEATISLAMLYESLGRVSVACKYFQKSFFQLIEFLPA